MIKMFRLFMVLLLPAMLVAITPDRVMKEVEKKMNSDETFHIFFTQTYVWEMTDETSSIEGELKLEGENRFRITTPDQIIVSNGKKMWTYSIDADRVLVDNISSSTETLLPKQIFFHYRKDYLQTMAPDEKIDSHDCYVILFQSQSGDEYFPKIRAWIDQELWVPRQIEQTDINDNRSIYTFKQILPDVQFPKETFEFTPPSSAEIIEL